MMANVWAVARKELRGFFQSAVALIFLLTFLFTALFIFFWVERFFGRNLADVRPLFEWFPTLLIFLVAALSMRMWSEEQKLGTIEVLLTMPVSVTDLVLGKFVAGMLLVAIGLALTFGVPLTVSHLGNLDWGPVIGGYVGSLLLAGAYLSIGLCVSAATSNQVLALIFTVLACGLLYLPGADAVAGLFDYDTAEIMRGIGSGSRFESIARGVIDLRDVVYYLSISAVMLVLNAVIVDAKRWGHGAATAALRLNAFVSVVLVVANALAVNVWLSPVHSARADLTEYGEHSVSPATDKLLENLDEPLVLRAYISHKMHPLVQPVVPAIRDLLREYGYAGGSKVRVEFVDPLGDETLENEAADDYGIATIPFEFEGRNEQSVINAYFSLLVKYGDQYQIIDLLSVLDIDRKSDGAIAVRLGNMEYEVTRTIKKLSQQFQSLDRVFAVIPGKVKITGYFTPDSLPPSLAEIPDKLKKAVDEITAAGGTVEFSSVVPTSDEERQQIYKDYGIRPFLDPLSGGYVYTHVLLQIGNAVQRLVLQGDASVADIRKTLVEAVRRQAPGYMKTVGVWAPKGFTMPAQNQFSRPQTIPPPQGFEMIKKRLGKDHKVVEVDLTSGSVPSSVDVLVVAGPDKLADKALYAIDQFLMRGGTTIIFEGRFRLARAQQLALDEVDTGLDALLEDYGVEVPAKLVMDSQSESVAVPEIRTIRGRQRQVLRKLDYPFFPRIKRAQMGGPDVITAGIPEVVMMYASPVKAIHPASPVAAKGEENAAAIEPPEREVLLRSSDDSWLAIDHKISPDFTVYPEAGFGKRDGLSDADKGPFDLAVALTGTFVSHFRDKGDPRLASSDADTSKDAKSSAADAEKAKKPDRTIKQSPANTRLVVVGSSVFVSDESRILAQLIGNDRPKNNMAMFDNTIDWALADADLISIRSRGAQVRTLDVAEGQQGTWELINYGIALMGLMLIAGITLVQRRRLQPMTLIRTTTQVPDASDAEDAEDAEDASDAEDDNE